MNPHSSSQDTSLPVADELLVDELCTEFEDAWKAGRQPGLEDYLNRAPASARPALLRELLCLDYHYHCQSNQTFPLEVYRERFPELNPQWLEAAETPREPVPGANGPETPDGARIATPTALAGQPIGRWLGDFELLEEIAHGGMGVVFRARQVSLNRHVALKLLRSGEFASEKEQQRFQLEAEAVAGLDHPHIVPVYEVGEHEGLRFFAMKLVEGGSLATRLAEFALTHQAKSADPEPSPQTRPPENAMSRQGRIAELMSTVGWAVHFAHQRGILHRDLKPSNILLDKEGTPFVTDFGLAKRVRLEASADGSLLTETGMLIGTPSYMAPEQARGDRGPTTARGRLRSRRHSL